jgi:hypothetical protein
MAKKALHLTTIPFRFIAAGELGVILKSFFALTVMHV